MKSVAKKKGKKIRAEQHLMQAMDRLIKKWGLRPPRTEVLNGTPREIIGDYGRE